MYATKYEGYNSGSGPSPAIWADCPWLSALEDPNIGYPFWDDFLDAMQDPTTAKIYGKYKCLDTGDCTLTAPAVAGGAVALFCTTDNEDCGICLGNGSAPFVISDTAGSDKKLWFECRVKKSVVTNAIAGGFIGLADETALAANFIADAGNDFADNDLIGFWQNEDDGDNVKFVYQITGSGFVTKVAALATLTADTYTKLGFKYDPSASPAERIKLYVNGVENATKVTAANIATSTFPDGEEMAPIFYINAASNTDCTFTMDWWRVFQLR